MTRKEITKGIKRTFAWWGLVFCSLIIKMASPRLLYGFAKVMARIGYYIAVKQRRIALESLRLAFGNEKNSREIKRIAKECFTFMAKSGVELMFLAVRPLLLKERVRFEGRENLDKALAKGKGVILLTAHFGNFPLMMTRITLEGYRLSGIMRRMRDERVERLFLKERRHLGIKIIYSQPRQTCVENSLRTLRNNEIVCIQLDQNFGTGGMFVDFFGKQAATATGPVVLALRTEAVILPCFILRSPNDTHRIIFEPEYKIKQAKTYQETVLINIQELTRIIESYIRRYPSEWGWIHRRWKSRPSSYALGAS